MLFVAMTLSSHADPESCSVHRRRSTRSSALARAAEAAAPPGLHASLDQPAATSARLALPPVDREPPLERPRSTARILEVGDGRAAAADGGAQHVAHREPQL